MQSWRSLALHYIRPSFTRLSQRNFGHRNFPGPATIQKVYQVINGFPAGGATVIESFEHVE